MFQPEENPTLSPEEFGERLRGLSEADYLRLEKIAKYRAKQCSLDPDELIQEAVTRALEGSRRCPQDIEVVPFLAKVMQSLCADANKAQSRKPSLLSLSDTAAGLDVPDKSPTPEEQWHSQQTLKELRDVICVIFHDDETAKDILEYLMEGYEAEEIRQDLNLDQTTYDSKRRFIRRRLDRHFKKEGGYEEQK